MPYSANPINCWKPSLVTVEIAEMIKEFNNDWLPLHSYDDDKVLHHYTDLKGLRGILNNRSLWSTNIRTLNDPFELAYGKELIISKLDSILADLTIPKIAELIRHMKSLVVGFGSYIFDIFVTCFCEDDNLLSQWRNYAARGGGYNIGLVFHKDTFLKNSCDNPAEKIPIILRKVIYDYKRQNDLINLYLVLIIAGASKALENKQFFDDPSWPAKAGTQAVNMLYEFAITMKNPVYQEEKEWRLIRISFNKENAQNLKFREQNNELIPYLDTFIADQNLESQIFPLKACRFGPMLDEDSTYTSLSLFLQSIQNTEHPIKITTDCSIKSAGFVIRRT